MMLNRIVIIIPAYNPDEHLLHLVDEIHNRTDYEIIVVNDGSGSESNQYFTNLDEKVILLCHKKNLGKGAAIKTALRYIAHTYNHTFGFVMADADGQHKVDDIIRVAMALQNHEKDLILGCRKFAGEVPARSRFGNTLTKTVFQMITKNKVSDTQTGLRGFAYRHVIEFLDVEGNRYEYEMNMLLKAVQNKIHMLEVPIETVYEGNNESSHFNVWRDSFLIYKQIFKYSLSSFASFIVDYCLFIMFFHFSGSAVFSNIIARLFSAAFNFTLNRNYVFEEKGSWKQSLLKYAGLASSVLVINTTLLNWFVNVCGGNSYLCKIAVECIMFLLNWLAQKHFVFRKDRCA